MATLPSQATPNVVLLVLTADPQTHAALSMERIAREIDGCPFHDFEACPACKAMPGSGDCFYMAAAGGNENAHCDVLLDALFEHALGPSHCLQCWQDGRDAADDALVAEAREDAYDRERAQRATSTLTFAASSSARAIRSGIGTVESAIAKPSFRTCSSSTRCGDSTVSMGMAHSMVVDRAVSGSSRWRPTMIAGGSVA